MTEAERVTQCRSALALANTIRAENARLKRDLQRMDSPESHALAITVLEAYEDGQAIGSCNVTQFMLSVRGVGPARARRWFSRLAISRSKRVRELSFRQLQGLVSELEASRDQIERSRRNYGRG